ncbi:MAG TPA: hypothetical protein VFZ59_05480, partial [Verrucomicrobiae bacterium]|nr:hypothetical protein [Verrucomicrobiae bacterium]
MGLRGHSQAPDSVWRGVTFVRDTVPPVLTLTNPVVGTVSQPVVQIQGFANEPLATVLYDVTNTFEMQTNLSGYVIGQFLDTNALTYTTNWFQCYDVGLATNQNLITLRVTDLAGNVTTTNLNLTLDYSGDTNAPSLVVGWPADNALVSGSNFILRGQVDDPTASIQIFADTSSIPATVIRDGSFVASEVPLLSATNLITIVATDAAGNSQTNSLTVRQSAETLTIDPISPGQLTQSTVTLTGTVGVSG